MQFRLLFIRHKLTGTTFPWPSYTRSIADSLTLARLTFSVLAYDIDLTASVTPSASAPSIQTELF